MFGGIVKSDVLGTIEHTMGICILKVNYTERCKGERVHTTE